MMKWIMSKPDLLDQFAMAAMQGMLAGAPVPPGEYDWYNEPAHLADVCYGLAQAMLAERESLQETE